MDDDKVLQRIEERRARRKKKKLRRTLLTLFIFVLMITVGIATAAYLSTNVYQNDEEFREYAKQKFKETDVLKVDGKTERKYEYNTPISYAVDYQVTDNELISKFREEKINEEIQKFKTIKTTAEAQRAAENENNSKYKPLEEALIIKSAVYEADNGAVSLALYCSENEEHENDMETTISYIDTYLISAETGRSILPNQVFERNYRNKCSEYFMEYFPKKYNEDNLKKGWKKYVAPDKTNFNKFIITDRDVVFYFDKGTVLKDSEGFVTVKVSKRILGDSIREAIIERYIQPDKPMVAITYDDGPGDTSEKRILKCLKKYGAVATFFYVGNRVSSEPENISYALELGCEIGNHTWSHPVLTDISKKQVASEIKKTNNAIKEACGQYPTVFRPSYGMTNEKVNKIADLPVIMWGVDTLDWKTRNAKKIFKAVKNTEELDGKIILMHSIHDTTADATELIIPWLQKRGYQTVTVSELIEYKTGKQAVKGQVY